MTVSIIIQKKKKKNLCKETFSFFKQVIKHTGRDPKPLNVAELKQFFKKRGWNSSTAMQDSFWVITEI